MCKPSKKELKEQYKNRTWVGGVYCIKCSNGDSWLRSTIDMQKSKNRFAFCVATNSSPEMSMQEVWKQFGPTSFSFEVMEEIKRNEIQTENDFAAEVSTLLELWIEKIENEREGTV